VSAISGLFAVCCPKRVHHVMCLSDIHRRPRGSDEVACFPPDRGAGSNAMPLPGCVAQDGSTYCILVLVQVVTCTSMYCSIEVPTLQRQHPKSWATTGSGNWIQGSTIPEYAEVLHMQGANPFSASIWQRCSLPPHANIASLAGHCHCEVGSPVLVKVSRFKMKSGTIGQHTGRILVQPLESVR